MKEIRLSWAWKWLVDRKIGDLFPLCMASSNQTMIECLGRRDSRAKWQQTLFHAFLFLRTPSEISNQERFPLEIPLRCHVYSSDSGIWVLAGIFGENIPQEYGIRTTSKAVSEIENKECLISSFHPRMMILFLRLKTLFVVALGFYSYTFLGKNILPSFYLTTFRVLKRSTI